MCRDTNHNHCAFEINLRRQGEDSTFVRYLQHQRVPGKYCKLTMKTFHHHLHVRRDAVAALLVMSFSFQLANVQHFFHVCKSFFKFSGETR